MICPSCCSEKIVRNGSVRNGKQKYICEKCGRQSAGHPEHTVVSQEKKDIAGRLPDEKISAVGICRAARVSERRLRLCVGKKSENIPRRQLSEKSRRDGRQPDVTDSALLSEKKKTDSGYGLRKTEKAAELPAVIQEKETETGRKDCGILFRRFTGSMLSVTQISGQLTEGYFLPEGTALPEKEPERQIILKGLTTHSGREFPVP